MIHESVVVLQNCMYLLKVVPGSCTEACPTTSCDGSQIFSIKVERDTDIQEEDPLLITFPEMKVEHEVSFMSVCPLLGIFNKYAVLPILSSELCLDTSFCHLIC